MTYNESDNFTKIIVNEIFIPYIGMSNPAVFVNLNSNCENVLLLHENNRLKSLNYQQLNNSNHL